MAVALSLLLFVMLANVLVAGYARGVLRAAVDEGARAASRATADPATCDTRASAALDQLLGTLAQGATVHCTVGSDRVVATGSMVVPAWLPAVPAFTFDVGAVAVRENTP